MKNSAVSFKKIVFSGIQPTGKIHLGNYLGAISNWVKLQNHCKPEDLNIFSIVDLHALSDKFKTDHEISFDTSLKEDTLILAATLMASGIDPKKSILFVQSHVICQVPEHSELCWILSCIAPMNWLNKMTQFKEKKSKGSSLGLYSYPVLMAADILLYKSNKVPVGEDQTQHLELARDYAMRFNKLFCKPEAPFFTLPELLQTEYPRVMSLRDGLKKMSKSDQSDFSRINLTDDPEVISDKILKARTDSLSNIKLDDMRPEVSNLLRMYAALKGISPKKAEAEFVNSTLQDFKQALAMLLVKTVCPIGEKVEQLLDDKENLIKILHEGRDQAREIANKNLNDMKKLVGML